VVLRYLLDTNICIYVRGRQPKVIARFDRLDAGEAAISVITYGELRFGVVKSTKPESAIPGLQRFTEIIPVLAMPPQTGGIYGNLRAALERGGATIGPNDLWIAAHALASGLTLVTNNEREFRRVKDLKIENWTK
jgi:tRNA(fMet)-specific endonuclease VapC